MNLINSLRPKASVYRKAVRLNFGIVDKFSKSTLMPKLSKLRLLLPRNAGEGWDEGRLPWRLRPHPTLSRILRARELRLPTDV